MHGVVVVGAVLHPASIGADAELFLSVNKERHSLFAFAQLVVFPQVIEEEGLQHVLLLDFYGIDAVQQAGVVHHHTGRLLGKLLALGVNHVDKAGVGQVFDVVHHRGARRLYVNCQLADVGRHRAVYRQQIKQLLYLGQIFQLNLLQQQDVHLNHHVHGLQQVLREVALLQEEGVETMVEIVLKILLWAHLGKDVLHNVLVVVEYVVEGVSGEIVARLQIDELTERESTQVVGFDDAVEFGVFLLQAHDRRPCEDNLQARIAVVAQAELVTPVGLLEHLVDEQHSPTPLLEFTGKVGNAASLKIEVVQVDVET